MLLVAKRLTKTEITTKRPDNYFISYPAFSLFPQQKQKLRKYLKILLTVDLNRFYFIIFEHDLACCVVSSLVTLLL